jgi:Na+/H+ antiporter NhaD/arsenite permease-like protein
MYMPRGPHALLAGFPPTLLQVSAIETLAYDSRNFAARLVDAGVRVNLSIWPELPHVWHAHYGKAGLAWALLIMAPLVWAYGAGVAAGALFHVLALEYLPFILMLFALFTAAGGLVIRGNLHGSPLVNTGFLLGGSLLASLIGTTGASMVLVRPLIRANDNRRHNVHVFVFFIFLVANIGGSLTPLGDPPLFLGFLRGVSFFWTTTHLWSQTVFALAILLGLFFAMDSWLYRKEGVVPRDPTPDSDLRVTGLVNVALIGVAVAAIIMSGLWKPGVGVTILGTRLELQNLLREYRGVDHAIRFHVGCHEEKRIIR